MAMFNSYVYETNYQMVFLLGLLLGLSYIYMVYSRIIVYIYILIC